MKKTISIILQGGLGAQLYQIAEVYRQAKKEKLEPIFDYRTARKIGQGEHPFCYLDNLYKNLPWSFNKPDVLLRGFYKTAPSKREITALKKVINLPVISPNFRTGLHIRRGDLAFYNLPEIPFDFYKPYLEEKALIFTDSPELCQIAFPKVEIYRGTVYSSFVELINCNKLVLSGSAFSNWAAYFSSPDSVISATSDLKLKSWQVIEEDT